MKIRNYYFFLIAVLCMSIVSCDTESNDLLDENKPTNDDQVSESAKLYPAKITTSVDGKESNTETFKYDENYKLIKWVASKDNYHTYEYDAKGKLQKVNDYVFNKLITYSLLSYNDKGFLSKQETFGNDDKLKSYNLYESNVEGLISVNTQFTTKDVVVLKFEYEYDDAKNLIQRKYLWANDEGVLNTTSYDVNSFKYDNKHNIFKWVPAINRTRLLVNNTVEEVRKNILKGETFSNVQKFQFEYNEYAYPLSYTDENGDSVIKTVIEYEIVK